MSNLRIGREVEEVESGVFETFFCALGQPERELKDVFATKSSEVPTRMNRTGELYLKKSLMDPHPMVAFSHESPRYRQKQGLFPDL